MKIDASDKLKVHTLKTLLHTFILTLYNPKKKFTILALKI